MHESHEYAPRITRRLDHGWIWTNCSRSSFFHDNVKAKEANLKASVTATIFCEFDVYFASRKEANSKGGTAPPLPTNENA